MLSVNSNTGGADQSNNLRRCHSSEGATSFAATVPARTSGILVSDDELMRQELASALSGFYGMRTYSLSDFNRISPLSGSAGCGFVIIFAHDPQPAFEALERVRDRSNVATLIVGPAVEQYCVFALERGADDYLATPVSQREMLARIRGILRFERQDVTRRDRAERASQLFGGWEYEHWSRKLTNAEGRRIVLTKGECAILKAFLDAPQRTLSRQHLINVIRLHEDIFDRSIDVRVLRLRRKLSSGGARPEVIRTERRVGYVFTLDVRQGNETYEGMAVTEGGFRSCPAYTLRQTLHRQS